MASKDKVDVVIVGAGMAGGLLAAKLAGAGKSVVVLEQGRPWAPKDMFSSQVWNRRHRGMGSPIEAVGDESIGMAGSGIGFGGSGIHHYAQWPRLKPQDFRTHSLFGKGADWPFGYDDLRPSYDKVQEEVGISGDHVKEVWRPAGDPYPMAPLLQFRQAEVMAEAFQKAGLRTAPMPLAINSEAYKGRPACLYDAWCDTGCPIGALADPVATYIPQARRRGADFRALSTATRVLTDPSGKRATGVEYYDEDGVRHVQDARLVILCGNPVWNARLLLNSAGPGHPAGLANRNDLVGRYFMAHLSVRVTGLFDEDLQSSSGVTGASLISQESYDKDMKGKPFGSYTWCIASAQKPIGAAGMDSRAFGQELHDIVKAGSRGIGGMTGLAEQLPAADNRIMLSDAKDHLGLPLARTVHTATAEEYALGAHMHAEGDRILKASSARKNVSRPGVWWQHLAGGSRMGTDPETSVCNGYGQTHEVGNLVLAGTGLFPTEGGGHPTYTMMAVTMRTADHLVAHWGAVAA